MAACRGPECEPVEPDETPFNEPLAMALCPAPCCLETLIFRATAKMVKRPECSRRFTADELSGDKSEIVRWPPQYKYLIYRRRVREKKAICGGGYPRMLNRLVDGVHGTCHEDFLQPIFTYYSWDRTSEKIRASRAEENGSLRVFGGCTFAIDEKDLNVPSYGHDSEAESYLADTLRMINDSNESRESVVAALKVPTTIPGSCMLDAISRGLVGRRVLSRALRKALSGELKANADAYKTVLGDFLSEEDWAWIMYESEVGTLPGMGNIHAFALANLLDRPIITLDRLEILEKQTAEYCATFLPLLRPESTGGCCDAERRTPLVIAWASEKHDHFVLIAGIRKLSMKRRFIRMQRKFVPRVWGGLSEAKEKKAVEDRLTFDGEGFCILSHPRSWFVASGLLPVVTAFNVADLRTIPVDVSLLSDYAEDCGRNAKEMPLTREITYQCRKARIQKRLVQCIECGHMSEIPEDGPPFNEAEELSRFCDFCCTLGNRLLFSDVNFLTGDHTFTPAPESNCRAKRKHFIDGNEFDDPESVGKSSSVQVSADCLINNAVSVELDDYPSRTATIVKWGDSSFDDGTPEIIKQLKAINAKCLANPESKEVASDAVRTLERVLENLDDKHR